MPRPSAASYSTIAPAKPPEAEATMTASEVAMNSALPSPQPARKPTIWLTVSLLPARAAKTTMIVRPVISVRLAPRRLDTQPVNSRVTWLGVASSCSDSAGRIGSTNPMPMKLTTQARATA